MASVRLNFVAGSSVYEESVKAALKGALDEKCKLHCEQLKMWIILCLEFKGQAKI